VAARTSVSGKTGKRRDYLRKSRFLESKVTAILGEVFKEAAAVRHYLPTSLKSFSTLSGGIAFKQLAKIFRLSDMSRFKKKLLIELN